MARKLLASRFDKGLAREARDFLILEDIEYDKEIIEEDVIGNEVHAIMLWKSKIITKDELKKLLVALEKIKKLHEKNKFKLDPNLEDVHLNIENFVIKEAGLDVGGKLHTGRSRNDQIILDTRLYLRKKINEIIELLLKLEKTILNLSEKHVYTIMPGYTHLQHAQPITFAHWLQGYFEMFYRDIERLEETYKRINLNPLGAGALAGTSWPIDRKFTTSLLGFDEIQANSLDVVSSRGEEAFEVISNLSIIMTHLSRLSQDLILWTTYEFGMIELDDAYTTGSSIMPQKKNPDTAELIRAKASNIHSNLFLVLSILKNLPSGYSKDTQETKHALIDSIKTVKTILPVMIGMLSTLKVNKERMAELVKANYSTATDLADLIVKKTGLSFREAHQIVGNLVKESLKKGKKITEITSEDLSSAAKMITGKDITITNDEIKRAVDPMESVKARMTVGSPNPEEVKRTIQRYQAKLDKKTQLLKSRIQKLNDALAKLNETVKELIGVI
jgi:argininosuccinate lyase